MPVTAAPAKLPVPATTPLPPLLKPDQQALYKRAFEALDAGRADEARSLARQGGSKLADKVFRWAELQQPHSGAAFEDIAAFIDANPSWPHQDVLMRRAEEALIDRTDDSVVLAWFALRAPLTVDGSMRYIEALLRSGDKAKAIQLIHSTWASGAFGAAQEKTFLARYRGYLASQDHLARLDRLLWDGRSEEAKRMMPRVDADHRALADARLKLAGLSSGAEYALRRVPARLANDEGLIFERLRWRRRKGQDQAALDMLRTAPDHVTRPDLWWIERNYLARRAISADRMKDAYEIATHHDLVDGAHFVDAEFLAGWVALRFLHEPKTALSHFTQLYGAAKFPVSLARGAYWAGRAASALGDKDNAAEWYHRAASYLTTYYGQLASAELDPAARPPFPQTVQPTDDERKQFDGNELVQVVRVLQQIGETLKVKAFVTRLVLNAKSPGEHTLVAELATRIDRPDLAVSAAKRSAQVAAVESPEYGWPMIPLPPGDSPEHALIYATIRQESAFETDAVSRVGARGLMQLITPTARAMAKKLGVETAHIETRLLFDPALNLSIGRTYLASLIDAYDGSYVLALAAYNAGPGRVRQWIRDNGDPRISTVDMVDWVELIPVDETRNYIHRVLENLQVYRARLNGTDVASGIAQDVRRKRVSEAR
ncbi:MAG: transglycosylase SLT domain-containing protein [Alphaproteobacteria bacterium]|nr:transglycosylase SLT domain-containing protein [Alphaproteobacteria bacterium]